MRDHKGYEMREMDWQDKLILWACVVVAILTVMLDGYYATPQFFQQFIQAFEAGVRYAEAFHGIKEKP